MSDLRTLRLLLCAALPAIAAAFALAVASDAEAAKKPCGEQVVNDWYGNYRVDQIYPFQCYLDAIKSLPPDVRDYSEAEDDIRRALAYARQGKPDPGPTGGPTPSGGDDDPTTTTPKPPDGTETDPPGTETGDDTQASPPVDTSGPSSIPLPLFILGGLALLLLAAGAAGYLSRRAQGRGPGGPPAS